MTREEEDEKDFEEWFNEADPSDVFNEESQFMDLWVLRYTASKKAWLEVAGHFGRRNEMEWRRIEDGLPYAPRGHWSDEVLVYTIYKGQDGISIDSYYHAIDGKGFWQAHRHEVMPKPTHWMPLPKPPRKEGKDG